MICVADNYTASDTLQSERSSREALLVFPGEYLCVVFHEPVVSVGNGVGRVEIRDVARLCTLHSAFEILMSNCSASELPTCFAQPGDVVVFQVRLCLLYTSRCV